MIGEQIIIHRPVDAYGLVPSDELTPEPELELAEVVYDEQGQPVPGVPTEFESDGWAVGPSNESEDQTLVGEVPVTVRRLFNRSRVDVRPGDEVTVRGERWKVLGEAADWRSPYSGFEGTVVAVSRVG